MLLCNWLWGYWLYKVAQAHSRSIATGSNSWCFTEMSLRAGGGSDPLYSEGLSASLATWRIHCLILCPGNTNHEFCLLFRNLSG